MGRPAATGTQRSRSREQLLEDSLVEDRERFGLSELGASLVTDEHVVGV